MDGSPYTPGAGHAPPVLAGRDDLLRDWQFVLDDVAAEGRVRAQDMILSGPRGVGKTVTVSAYADLARESGFEVVSLQAVTGHAGLTDALLSRAKTRIADGSGPWQRARKAFERIEGVNLSVAVFGAGVTAGERAPSPPMVDAGNLAQALTTLADEIAQDAPGGGLLITVDELQVASAPDLALLAATLHRLNVDHPRAPVVFAATGLPFTPEALRKAGVTHPDRLFVLETIPLALDPDDARYAVVEPARQVGVTWERDAANAVIEVSNGYPAHLQLFAHGAWTSAAGGGSITMHDVEIAIPLVASQVERRTLGPRWDRISDRQMEFLAALALLGGRSATATVARALGRTHQEISWLREELIEEGDVYVPRRGQLAMAIPLFSRYVLSRYERSRPDAAISLLALDDMAANAGIAPPDITSEPGIGQ